MSNQTSTPKPRRRRLSNRELFYLFVAYPLLWLFLGLAYNPAIFTFWKIGQSINRYDAMALGSIPLVFSIIYLPLMLIIHDGGKTLHFGHTLGCALVALVVAFICVPIP